MAEAQPLNDGGIQRARSSVSLTGSQISTAETEYVVTHYRRRLNDTKIVVDQHQQTGNRFIDPLDVTNDISLILNSHRVEM